MAFIEVRQVLKEYSTATALRGVDLDIEYGSWCSIIGASGSGKSTLLNILGGLDSPTGGKVHIDGTDVSSLGENAMARFRREHIGIIFQQSHLVPYLTSVENVMLSQYFHSMTDRTEAEEALGRVAMGHRLEHRPSQLSGGEQQRVSIARALVNNPVLLLADEPTGALDTQTGVEIMSLFQRLNHEGITIVLVTHELEIARFSRRILRFRDGSLVGDEIVKHPNAVEKMPSEILTEESTS